MAYSKLRRSTEWKSQVRAARPVPDSETQGAESRRGHPTTPQPQRELLEALEESFGPVHQWDAKLTAAHAQLRTLRTVLGESDYLVYVDHLAAAIEAGSRRQFSRWLFREHLGRALTASFGEREINDVAWAATISLELLLDTNGLELFARAARQAATPPFPELAWPAPRNGTIVL